MRGEIDLPHEHDRDETVRTIGAVLASAAERHPDREAIRFEGQVISYSTLYERARAAAAGFRACGVSRGDRVLLMLPNGMTFLDSWLGMALGGIIEVPINTEYRGEMLRYIIESSGASTIVIHSDYVDRLLDLGPSVGTLDRLLISEPSKQVDGYQTLRLEDDVLLGSDSAADLPELEEHDLVANMYTSGTTGPSKGALITHRHAYEYARAVVDLLEIREGDVYFAPLPLFHIAGQWAVVYACMQAGATAVLKKRFSVGEFWTDCRREGVTVSFLLGAMAQFLHGQHPRDDDRDNPLERVLMVPLIEGLQDFRSRFEVRVTTCYGSTEVNVPIMADFSVSDPRIAGQAAPGYELRIVDENDNDVPPGSPGELLVRPPEPWMTMVAYHGDPEATNAAMKNLWLHSGDAFRADEDGNYYFVDRIKDAIRRRGENISSFDVEREVNAFPAVMESAAVAAPSEYTEDEIKVFAVAKPGLTVDVEELRAFLERRMPRFVVPKFVEIIDEMPKTPTGKIQKHLLREKPT